MTGAFRIAIIGMAGALLLSAGAGCTNTISAEGFVATYTTNIQVPKPDYHQLPTRSYEGQRGDYFYIKDSVPFGQGGGFFGKTTYWRCGAEQMPAGFPIGHRPGDLVLDGRDGAAHKYMIQSYDPSARPPPPTSRPAIQPAVGPTGQTAGQPVVRPAK